MMKVLFDHYEVIFVFFLGLGSNFYTLVFIRKSETPGGLEKLQITEFYIQKIQGGAQYSHF